METKVFVLILALAVVTGPTYGGDIVYSYDGVSSGLQDYHSPARYSYEYSVNDPFTGDVKSHKESREGDTVVGYYTMKEADGSIREVHYTADSHNGFNAVVTKTGLHGQSVEVHGNQHQHV